MSMFSSCGLIGTSIHNLNAHQMKFFHQHEKRKHVFTVVNVVSYISGYILRKVMLQSKCLDCLRMPTDTSKGV